MAHRGWLQLGQTELVNVARTVAYMRAGVRNLSAEVVTDDSWPLLPVWLGREEVWQRPEWDDDCPWYDQMESASAEFAGVWPMSIEGLDVTPIEREVIDSALDGAGFGVARMPARVIKVEAVVVGATPAGLRYGLEWLGATLRGEGCADGGQPRSLMFLDAAPVFDAQIPPAGVQRLGNAQARMVAQVVLTRGVEVEEFFSPWVAEHRGATMARVTWEMTAGAPWVWRLPTPLLSGLAPYAGEPEEVRFERVGADGVCPSSCAEELEVLVDPSQAPLSVLPRPLAPAAALACSPLLSRRSRWVVEAGRVSRFSETLPTMTIRTGPKAERAIRIQWLEGVVREGVDMACSSVGEAMIGYLPANATCTLDATTGEATVITAKGRRLDASPVITGRAGGPWRAPVMRCAKPYTLVVDTAQDVHRSVRIDVDAVVRAL